MRMMAKITIPPEQGNIAVQDGSLPKLLQQTIERIRPEATYFHTENGHRTMSLYFDLKNPAEMPVISEPFFTALNATVQFTPVMNLEDLKSGLATLASKR